MFEEEVRWTAPHRVFGAAILLIVAALTAFNSVKVAQLDFQVLKLRERQAELRLDRLSRILDERESAATAAEGGE